MTLAHATIEFFLPLPTLARSVGLHRNIATIHGDMLEHAVYLIKTKLGISEQYYAHSSESPVFGTSQGSCSSPPAWAINVSGYFDIYDDNCHGAHYTDMQGSRKLKIRMMCFVGDNSCQVNCKPVDKTPLCARETHDAQQPGSISQASSKRVLDIPWQ